MSEETHREHEPREEFLTARQLASVMQVSEATVRRLARSGRIPSVRLTPRLLRFHLPSVREALNGGPSARSRSPRHKTADDGQEEKGQQLSFTDLL